MNCFYVYHDVLVLNWLPSCYIDDAITQASERAVKMYFEATRALFYTKFYLFTSSTVI